LNTLRIKLKGSSKFSIFDFANIPKLLKKGTAVKSNNTFSLSLQKQIEQQHVLMDSEINSAFNELNFRSLLHRSNITKQKGYATITLLFLIVLLPFLKRKLSDFWNSKCLQNQIDAQKDTYYRFLNHERFNWRKLVYLLALKVIDRCDDVPLAQKVLIGDDSISPKSGEDIELISYHFDHKTKRSILGNRYLQLAFHNGINLLPLDVAFNTSTYRPNVKHRDIDKRTNGWRRRKEALSKKTTVFIQMIQRAWQNGIDASFVLFDSWFAHDSLICEICAIGYGVICRLKKGRVKYNYQGTAYTLKQLWQQVAKKQTTYISKFQVKAVCLNVCLPKTGVVRILFVSDGKKDWQALLCTDLEIEASDILSYYARRWAIEVFFKDAKQMLYMGKEQSNTFDAIVAGYSLVMIRYLLLVYILSKRRLKGPIGPLFREIGDNHSLLWFAEKIWVNVKELIIRSSHIISYKIEPDIILHFIDIIEETIVKQTRFVTAKL